MNNVLMFVMKMESMDEMEDESKTMNMLAPAVDAVQEIMEDMEKQAGSSNISSSVSDHAIVESMLSPTPPIIDATGNLEESEATSWSGKRNLLFQDGQGCCGFTDSQQALWSMAYYSFCIILMNAGYVPTGPLNDVTSWGRYFDFAKVVADYVSEYSGSFFSSSSSIATQADYGTSLYNQFKSIFDILGIGKQLALARNQDALGPLRSNYKISRLYGKLIVAVKNLGAASTQGVVANRVQRGNVIYDGAFADFTANMCKLNGNSHQSAW
jgi:hypothetical protein